MSVCVWGGCHETPLVMQVPILTAEGRKEGAGLQPAMGGAACGGSGRPPGGGGHQAAGRREGAGLRCVVAGMCVC